MYECGSQGDKGSEWSSQNSLWELVPFSCCVSLGVCAQVIRLPLSHLAGPWLYFGKNSPGCGDSNRAPTFTNEPAMKKTLTIWEQARWVPLRSGLLPWSCQRERMHRNIVLLVGFSHEHCPAILQLLHVCARAGQTHKRRCWEPMFLTVRENQKQNTKTPCHSKEMWEQILHGYWDIHMN